MVKVTYVRNSLPYRVAYAGAPSAVVFEDAESFWTPESDDDVEIYWDDAPEPDAGEWCMSDDDADAMRASLVLRYPYADAGSISTYVGLYADGYTAAQCSVMSGLSDPEQEGFV